jgi:hypothetical protein
LLDILILKERRRRHEGKRRSKRRWRRRLVRRRRRAKAQRMFRLRGSSHSRVVQGLPLLWSASRYLNFIE